MTDTRHLDRTIGIFKSKTAKRGKGTTFTYYRDTKTLQGPRGKTINAWCTEAEALVHVARVPGAKLNIY